MNKFIDARTAWSYWSIKWQAAFAAAVGVWQLLPDDQKTASLSMIPVVGPAIAANPGYLVWIGIAATIYLRMKIQAPQEAAPQ